MNLKYIIVIINVIHPEKEISHTSQENGLDFMDIYLPHTLQEKDLNESIIPPVMHQVTI